MNTNRQLFGRRKSKPGQFETPTGSQAELVDDDTLEDGRRTVVSVGLESEKSSRPRAKSVKKKKKKRANRNKKDMDEYEDW